MTSSTAWPKSVIARYLTAAGVAIPDAAITVDITDQTVHAKRDQRTTRDLKSSCTGCGLAEDGAYKVWFDHELDHEYTAEINSMFDEALPKLKDWARAHAETCRAVPNPNA